MAWIYSPLTPSAGLGGASPIISGPHAATAVGIVGLQKTINLLRAVQGVGIVNLTKEVSITKSITVSAVVTANQSIFFLCSAAGTAIGVVTHVEQFILGGVAGVLNYIVTLRRRRRV